MARRPAKPKPAPIRLGFRVTVRGLPMLGIGLTRRRMTAADAWWIEFPAEIPVELFPVLDGQGIDRMGARWPNEAIVPAALLRVA